MRKPKMLHLTRFITIVICFIIYIIAPIPASSSDFTSIDLQRTAEHIKPDRRPLGTVGVLFFTYIDDVPHFLLARESQGSHKGTYSEFGGSLELNAQGEAETFLEGCIRECNEESSGLYNPSPEDLFQSKIYYEKTSKGREVVLCLVETKNVFQTSDLLAAQQHFQDSHFKEKDALSWINVNDLLNESIKLRPFFKEIIEKPKFKMLIEGLNVNTKKT